MDKPPVMVDWWEGVVGGRHGGAARLLAGVEG